MENKIIEVSGLSKKYTSANSFALDHIDLTIHSGSIFGLLGPNGAGKSTFINILSGLTNKSSGVVKVCGIDLDENPKTVRGNIGVVPQEINIDPFFSPIQIMDIQAGLYGVKKENNKNLEILKNLDLFEKAKAYSRSLSGGMKRRLMVAKAMVHNPPLLILDEPTAGVDVELRSKLWDSIRTLNKKGVTIILTTHYLKEAEILCDRIAVINKGKVIACDEKKKFMQLLDEKELIIEFSEQIKKIPSEIKKYCKKKEKKSLTLKFKKSKISTADIIKIFVEKKFKLKEISTKESDLEDIFIKLLKE
ncbi:MAG: multidrug ABC transporter ATP-binding protein [Alphaproteobacteria bacterium]|jgi:ABC-2 type transport system ATP-binding protein|nr:multidrug ABC transporter ATP-binding protein [Alphaproteobacteria bacterium]|tara:strand:+ start:1295 stop:2209 length:915 start_codon:yes stop_codon:yes gene_type:complete